MTTSRLRSAVLFFAAAAMCLTLAPSPALAQLDTDNDGLNDLTDPCPLETRNLCFGPVAIDQNTGQTIRLNAGGKLGVECTGERIDCNDPPLCRFSSSKIARR